ncbi:hypothetical protein ROZALSC1DRAFT_24991 [Rozella allomycis CSF55]|uniref:Uncharacterized protein n=1 Tax=Rozella allomycis (strain CSF55) TaxID=988480 RepID=A0A4P9YBP3_ROZAC|nr:hypothetical protein ROZALSC1DRAFT_24991 [Rozella allomycis CSF55]
MFLCCLRFDEARSLRFEWASMPINYFELRLPFRKTNHDGKGKDDTIFKTEIQVFPLEATQVTEICPFMHLWIGFGACERLSGPMITIIDDKDVLESNAIITRAYFLKQFRQHLLSINLDPSVYGTQSFRRGGVQYLAKLGLNIHQSLMWAGWSSKFNEQVVNRYWKLENNSLTLKQNIMQQIAQQNNK